MTLSTHTVERSGRKRSTDSSRGHDTHGPWLPCEIVVFSLEDVFFVFPAAFKTKDLDMVKIFL